VSGEVEGLLRELAPQVLAMLTRRHGQFDACEDAVQEALLAASQQWPAEGVPDNPRAWLLTVGSRRLADAWRSDSARRRREESVFAAEVDDAEVPASDDTLTLLFLCCHPTLTPASQVALTVRAVGGLTTAQVARAFLVPEATMAQRISRAKQKIKKAGAQFSMPPKGERDERLRAVLHVLYLVFNEGYTATAGDQLLQGELTGEAIRLTRGVRALLPDDGEVAGEEETSDSSLLSYFLSVASSLSSSSFSSPALIGPDSWLSIIASATNGWIVISRAPDIVGQGCDFCG